jgi:hypothetical protein
MTAAGSGPGGSQLDAAGDGEQAMTAETAPAEVAPGIPHKYRRFTLQYLKLKIRDRLLQFAYSIPMGHIAVWIAVVVYFLATQKIPWVTYHWNHLLPWAWWAPVRHDIRNGILEGELAAGAVLIAFANALHPPAKTKFSRFLGWLLGYTAEPDWVDKALMFIHAPDAHQVWKRTRKGHVAGDPKRTTIWQYIFFIPSVLLAGLPGNLAGFAYFYGIKPGILDLLHKVHVHLYGWSVTAAAGTGTGATEANIARAGFDAKVIGVLGTLFFARRLFRKVGIDYAEFLAEEHAHRYVSNLRAHLGHARNWLSRPRWPLPATYRGLVWHEVIEEQEGKNKARRSHGHAMRWVTLAIIPALAWLAWYGQSILAAHGGV